MGKDAAGGPPEYDDSLPIVFNRVYSTEKNNNIKTYTRRQSQHNCLFIYNKIVYCQCNMFRPFIGSSSGPLEIQIQGLYVFFSALWDPRCLQD